MIDEFETESFQTSILYWVGVLEAEANLRFVRDMGGGRSDVQLWRTLSILSELDGTTISELSHHTRIERTALSHILTAMERQDLVERRPRADNRRTIEVHLLPLGRDLFTRMLPVRRAVMARATRGIPRSDLISMMEVTRRLVANLREEDAGAEPVEDSAETAVVEAGQEG